jgi:hypothetical protein
MELKKEGYKKRKGGKKCWEGSELEREMWNQFYVIKRNDEIRRKKGKEKSHCNRKEWWIKDWMRKDRSEGVINDVKEEFW